MVMTAILFNDAERIEQIDKVPLTGGPKCNLVKIGQTVLQKKMFIVRFYTCIQYGGKGR